MNYDDVLENAPKCQYANRPNAYICHERFDRWEINVLSKGVALFRNTWRGGY